MQTWISAASWGISGNVSAKVKYQKLTFFCIGNTSPGYGHVINHMYKYTVHAWCCRALLAMAVQAENECPVLLRC